ncbi:hypothetical protein QBC43DRAFT_269123 [Cladorrhinum sp. PSN259]|nr:hypothetical protein QBC43DRAFT_269123 [Cladorrhinum sp. PSN259]
MSIIDYGENHDPRSSDNIITPVILACAIAPVFAFLFVCARFYTARSVLRTIHADDWLILPAMVMSIAFSICIIVMTNHGLGQRIWYLIDNGWRGKKFALLSGFAGAITSNIATMFTKCSILVFYQRFSTSRQFTIALYTMMVIVIIANSLGAFGALFVCRPMRRFWDLSAGGGCLDQHSWYAWLIIVNCVSDGILLILPAWILAPLTVRVSQKVAIAAILGTGGFVVGVSILRVVVMMRTLWMDDMTYRFAINYFWSVVEMNTAIVCACAPCLRPLLGRFIPSLSMIGIRRNPDTLYTLPVSQLAQRRPAAHTEVAEHGDTGSSTVELTTNWHTKYFGSEPGSSKGKEQQLQQQQQSV